MAALPDHLGSQVLWSATVSHTFTVLIEEIRPPKVSQLDGVLSIEQYVFWLNISMNNWRVLRVQILHCLDNFSNELSGNTLREAALSFEASVDLAAGSEFQDEVEGVIIFIVIVKLYDILVVELVHDFDLKLDLLNQVVLDDLRFVNDLDSIDVFGNFVADFVHFSEAADTDVGIGE